MASVLLLCPPLGPTARFAATTLAEPEMRVAVGRRGAAYTVDATVMAADVGAQVAWEVVTDFDRMSVYIPNLVESRVTGRNGDRLVVAQKGVARLGIFRHSFETLREVRLHPYDTVDAWTIGGSVAKVESTTRLEEAPRGTRISYRVEVIPGFWIPSFVTEAVIRSQVRELLAAVVREMMRRQTKIAN